MKTILVIDDDETFRHRLGEGLTRRGFEVSMAEDVATAIEVFRSDPTDRVVLDMRMPDGTGLDFLEALSDELYTTDVVILTGYGSIAQAVEATKLGAVNFITKPATVDEILAAFDKVDVIDVDEEIPSLARVEWEYIQKTLDDCDGNISKAAKRLKLHRRTLQRKLDKFAPKD